MGFADSLKKAGDNAILKAQQGVAEVAQTFFTDIVDLSPVQPFAKWAKGEFVNNWVAAANSINRSYTSARSMAGSESRSSIASVTTNLRVDGDFYLTLSNSTDHGNQVEYVGWKRTPPYAPIRKAIVKAMARKGSK